MIRKITIKNLTSAAILFAVFTASAPTTMLSCQAETAGQPIRFAVAIEGINSKNDKVFGFETTAGWTVTIESAYAAFGPVYFYSGESMANKHSHFFGWGIASACPTHAQFNYGTILGEVLEQYAADLLATEPVSMGEIKGEAGNCRSVELHLHPPGAEQLSAGNADSEFRKLENHSVSISGTAQKGENTIPFHALLDIPDEGTMRIIQNIGADVELSDTAEKPGRLILQVLLDAWFDRVDFLTLQDTNEDGIYLFGDDTQAKTALLLAIRNRYSYKLRWSEQ